MTPWTRRPTHALLAAAVLATAALSTPAGATPPIWRVHAPGGGELTLFGSVHLLSDKTDWRDPALDADLKRAGRLVFEIPLDPAAQSEAQARVLRAGLLPAGETLSTLLSPDGRARLARVAAGLGMDASRLEPLRPWLAEVTVSLLYFQHRGASPDLGVEKTIDQRTPAAVPRGALETVADQIDALSGDPQADQVQSLEETLREIEQEPDSYDRLAAAWAAGDVRLIQREGLDDLREHAPGAFKRLVSDRNRRWVPELEAMLKDHQRAVVVVGVGHLVGPDGVPALLRRDGLRVDGP